MNLLKINYIDGQTHDLSNDYKLLSSNEAFEVEFCPTDSEDINKLDSELEAVVTEINNIKDEKGKLETVSLFLKALSNQLGRDFSSIEELKEHFRVMKDQASFVEKDSHKADNDLNDLKVFKSGSDLVDLGDLNG